MAQTLKQCQARLKQELQQETENKVKPKRKRQRYPQFFEAEQLLDEQEAFHADITVCAKLDLNRAGLGATGVAFANTAEATANAAVPRPDLSPRHK